MMHSEVGRGAALGAALFLCLAACGRGTSRVDADRQRLDRGRNGKSRAQGRRAHRRRADRRSGDARTQDRRTRRGCQGADADARLHRRAQPPRGRPVRDAGRRPCREPGRDDDHRRPGRVRDLSHPGNLRADGKTPPAINVAAYVGHGNIRTEVMGKDGFRRHATPEEIEKMRKLVEAEMQAGALGLSPASNTTRASTRRPRRSSSSRRWPSATTGATSATSAARTSISGRRSTRS